MLNAVLTHTPDWHPDYDDLAMALEKVKATNDTINERKRIAQNNQKLIDIQNNVVVPPAFNMVSHRSPQSQGC